jgi:hypothetical protein
MKHQLKTTWKGFRGKGKTGYDKVTASKELINNVIRNLNRPLVNLQLVVDSERGKIWFIDDMSGVSLSNFPLIMNDGQSIDTGSTMKEHGAGMKFAINYFGEIVSITASTDGFDFHKLVPDKSTEYATFEVKQKCDNFQRFSLDKGKWVDSDTKGFCIEIDLDPEYIPQKKTWFNGLVSGLSSAYWMYLGKNLNVDIIWLKGNKPHMNWTLEPAEVILSNNPKHGTIDTDKKLGKDEWELDELFKCPDTGHIVELKIGRVPELDLVKNHYSTERYERYQQSPYRYNGEGVGIHYSKQWIPVSGGQFKASSRDENLFGFINIVEGIHTYQTKNGIVRPNDDSMDIFEENLERHLRRKGFRVRAKKGYFRISEKEMEKNILKMLQNNKDLRELLGFNDDNIFDNKELLLKGGVPDIYTYKKDNVVVYEGIFEVKKEGGDRLYKAIVQALVYCISAQSKKAFVIAQDVEMPKEIYEKFEVLANELGIGFEYYQYQYLADNYGKGII